MTNKAKYIPLFILLFLIVVASVWATSPAGYVPAYSARSGYDDATLRELLVVAKLIHGEVRLMREQQNASASAAPIPFKGLVAARCAQCHGEANYQEEGAGFMLLTKAGEVAPLNDAEKRRVRREINLNRMPKNHPPLSVVEKQVFQKALPLPEDK